MTYYDTTRETPSELAESRRKAIKQEDVILHFFRSYPEKSFTPFEVRDHLFDDSTPVTSIRRAITNLTDEGELEMLDEKRKGKYGKLNHTWRVKREGQQRLF